MRGVLIIGATSGIGSAIARSFAKKGLALVIAGRRKEALERLANDMRIRYGAEVKTLTFDAVDFESHEDMFNQAVVAFHGLEGIVFAVGMLPDQQKAQTDYALAKRSIDINLSSAVSLLNVAANYFEEQQSGFICAISSVAGDRGRKSNYIYGMAKAGLSTYMEGLRHRLAKAGVTVLTVKPGFVDTKMTYGQEGLFLVASPEKVADRILMAIKKQKNTIYTPSFWRLIMAMIKRIPHFIFKRLDL
jgi:short-subunit dehydrogenase